MWGSTAAEVFEKGKKIVQILLKAGFAIRQSEVKGPAQEVQFLGIKWQDFGSCQIPMEVINKITAMSPTTGKKETSFFRLCGFLENAYSRLQSDGKPSLSSDPEEE